MKDYHSRHAVRFEESTKQVYLDMPVLEFLKGRPWDELALAAVSTLRPSYIRVSTGEVTTDSRPWRVTVIVDAADRIQEVTQEVVAWCPEGYRNGYELSNKLFRDQNPPEVAPDAYVFATPGALAKLGGYTDRDPGDETTPPALDFEVTSTIYNPRR